MKLNMVKTGAAITTALLLGACDQHMAPETPAAEKLAQTARMAKLDACLAGTPRVGRPNGKFTPEVNNNYIVGITENVASAASDMSYYYDPAFPEAVVLGSQQGVINLAPNSPSAARNARIMQCIKEANGPS